ncbi:MAG: response regulator [Candidatus Andersenbacteria bacterium]|nr:response regulator [Candidatus Andersenbacteria bacterium]
MLTDESQDKKKTHVLIVEDDSFISLFLEKKLTELGYGAKVAASTAQALEALAAAPVDLILLDIILPDENGFTLLERLKKNPAYQDIPVVILSNLGQQSEIDRGKQLGAVDFLVKGNYSPAEIVERITAILKQTGKAKHV